MKMERIEAQSFNLFDVETPIGTMAPKPRVATPREIIAYARQLATRAGLYPYEDAEDRGGAVTFGEKLHASKWETVDGQHVQIEAIYQDGAYSIPLPGRDKRETVTMETIGDDGAVSTARTLPIDPKKGGIIWDKAAVAKAVGPVEKVKRPRTPNVERISDREAMRIYCDQRATELAQAVDALAVHHNQIATDVDPEAPQMPQDTPAVEMAVPQPEPSPAPSIADAAPLPVENERAGSITIPAEAFAALMARVAKLEARLPEPEIESCNEPAAESGLSHKNIREIMRPARLRLVRRYLAMRAARDHERQMRIEQVEGYSEMVDQLEAARTLLNTRAMKSEARAEAAEFELADLRGKLASVEKRAEEADAKWAPIVDQKQARIVALEDRLLQLQSGGRIKGTIAYHAPAA